MKFSCKTWWLNNKKHAMQQWVRGLHVWNLCPILHFLQRQAKYLADKGLADAKKLCITGGSAGGYTTLACLAFRCSFNQYDQSICISI